MHQTHQSFFKIMSQKEQYNSNITPTKLKPRRESSRLRLYYWIRKILVGIIFALLLNLVFANFFFTPKMYNIHNQNSELLVRYKILQNKIEVAQRKLSEIQHRDNHVYRPLFGTDTIHIEGIDTPYPNSKYEHLTDDKYTNLMTNTWQQLDQLGRSLYMESVSFDELQILAKDKELMSAAIPAIWPIDRTKLNGNHIGAFNPRRFHPVYKRIIPHKGVDFGCPTGTPVYASGDAIVEHTEIGYARRGYGKQVLLNHQFGYKTRYAHLSEILVKEGDSVKRGDLIGKVGNTGVSTSSHLHYEVILNGVHVNPINYFNRNMTHEEYLELMDQMKDTNYEAVE